MTDVKTLIALSVSVHNLALKRCFDLLSPSAASIRLACGELTAQEMRTVKAVLAWKRKEIEKLFRKTEGMK